MVLSPDNEQTNIIALFIFYSFSSLLVPFPLICPCPFPASKWPNKPICVIAFGSKNFGTQQHYLIPEGPSFPYCVFNKLNLIKGNFKMPFMHNNFDVLIKSYPSKEHSTVNFILSSI